MSFSLRCIIAYILDYLKRLYQTEKVCFSHGQGPNALNMFYILKHGKTCFIFRCPGEGLDISKLKSHSIDIKLIYTFDFIVWCNLDLADTSHNFSLLVIYMLNRKLCGC